MKRSNRNGERGVALFLSVLALLLLTGIAAALLLVSNTDASIDSNYRNEQVAYFGAKSGMEEARARVMSSDPAPITPPTAIPATGVQGVFYIVNSSLGAQPWNASNAYADDELCHDGYSGLGLTAEPPDVRCVNSNGNVVLPSGSWYNETSSNLPENSSYAWVRIAPKVNNSVTYLQGSGSTATTQTYYVSSNSTVEANNPLICWDGQEELPLAGAANCSAMVSIYNNVPTTQVYLVTSMGVASNGARKVVQSEIALQPTAPFPYGLYATSESCSAIVFNGSNPGTNSYNGTYPPFLNGGDVGSNGGVSVGNATVDGSVGVLSPSPNNCPLPTAGPNITGGVTTFSTAYSFPNPPSPNPLPPTTSYSPPSCGGHHSSGNCMTAGTYGNITVNGTLYMAPGIYNVNSLQMQGNGAIIVNPPGAITLNIEGAGTNPLKIDGNGITDDSNPNDFIINYAGNGSINVQGNGNVTAILNAPNASVAQAGNGAWYGSMVLSTATIGGNAWFHYDQLSALAPANNGHYTMINYRLVPY